MPNRNLTPQEHAVATAIVKGTKALVASLANGDQELEFAYVRKLAKELQYVERGKPMARRSLKAKKRKEQEGRCKLCQQPLPEKYAVLDRLTGMGGYTAENTRLICQPCDTKVQRERRYT